jgi:hypothetical protein
MLRILAFLAALAAAGLGGWWFLGRPAAPRDMAQRESPQRESLPRDVAPRTTPPERAPRPSTFAAPSPGGSGLQTPLGDALFRWRCTTGLRDALGGRADWPLRRVAGFCLCVADRMREDGLREVPQFRGDGLAAALAVAEASLCRPP